MATDGANAILDGVTVPINPTSALVIANEAMIAGSQS
jgi:hypothetical protein